MCSTQKEQKKFTGNLHTSWRNNNNNVKKRTILQPCLNQVRERNNNSIRDGHRSHICTKDESLLSSFALEINFSSERCCTLYYVIKKWKSWKMQIHLSAKLVSWARI